MMPGTANLSIYRGDDYRQAFNFTQSGAPLALPTTGWLANVRPFIDAPSFALFAVDATAGATGLIVVTLTGAQTSVLKSGVWDLQNTTNGQVTTWLAGVVAVSKDVTYA